MVNLLHALRAMTALVVVASSSARADATSAVPPQPAAPAVEQRVLEVRVAGAPFAKRTSADLAKLKPLPSAPGNGAKTTLYPLHDALAAWVGPGARLASVVMAGGMRLAIEEKAWSDPTRAMVLWQNRRGLFKVGFVDVKGQLVPGQEIRDVVVLDVVKP